MDTYNARLQRELARTVWSETERSWYKTAAGVITNNWSGSTIRYWWKTRRPDLRAYDAVSRTSLGESTADDVEPVVEDAREDGPHGQEVGDAPQRAQR